MKKSKTFFAYAMLAALASCSNDHVLSQQSPTPSDPDVINIVAASSKPATRATQDAGKLQDTQFAENEKINVYLSEHTTNGNSVITYEQPLVYTVSNTPATSSGIVLDPPSGVTPKFPSNDNGVDAYALYPQSVKETVNNATFTVPTDQSDDGKYRDADMMFGTNKLNSGGQEIQGFTGTPKGKDVELYFKHQLSKVIVKMDVNSFSSGYLTNASIKLKGVKNQFTYKASKNGVEIISLNNSEPSVDVDLGTYSTDGNAGIIAPQTITGEVEFIEITKNESPAKTYVYKIPTGPSKTFESGKKYIYNIKLSGGSLVVVSTKIEEWGTGETVEGTADLKTES